MYIFQVHFHGADMNSLHNFISPEYLPIEWGGKQPPYNTKDITRLIKENENKLIGISMNFFLLFLSWLSILKYN